MNGIDPMARYGRLLKGGTLAICALIAVVGARRVAVSLDSFWHLRMGQDWLERGLSPWVDHLSFTFAGAPVESPPYLFQALLAGLVAAFGQVAGYELYKFGAALATLGLVVMFLRGLKASVVIWCLTLLLVAALLQLRAVVRPELLSYAFSVAAVMLYHRGGGRLDGGAIWPMAVLLLVWTNYHSSIFGYVLFFGYFLDAAWKLWRESGTARDWLGWAGWGAALVAAGFVNPSFSHPVLATLQFAPEWAQLIREYQSPAVLVDVPAAWVLVGFTIVTAASALLLRAWGLVVVIVIMSAAGLTMARLVTPAGVVIACLFAWTLTDLARPGVGPQWPPRPGSASAALGGVLGVLAAGLLLFSTIGLARAHMAENRTSHLLFPFDVADYMASGKLSGRVFNPYDVGGYLAWRLGPGSSIYIDGRSNILYPLDFFLRAGEAERSDSVLREELERYQVDLIVLPSLTSSHALVYDAGGFGLEFAGQRFALYRRSDAAMAQLGALLAYPACWRADLADAVAGEAESMRGLLPLNSPLPALASSMLDYGSSNDPEAWLAGHATAGNRSDESLRFAAYQALVRRKSALAESLFAAMESRSFGDVLGAAAAAAQSGDWRLAEATLDAATRMSASQNVHEIALLAGLLREIREASGLERFDQAYLDSLETRIGELKGLRPATRPRDFCPANRQP